MDTDSTTQQIGLFGYPLGHSISPAFQQAALDHYSLPVAYLAWPTPPQELAVGVERLRGDRYIGANVTIPHKETMVELVDHVDPWANKVGAVNTVVKRDGAIYGHNTDSYGFITSLTERAGFEPEGKSVLMLGAGGAARAAAYGLARDGAASLTIANRTVERAESLARNVSAEGLQCKAVPLAPGALAETSKEADLIVNATSVGMTTGEAQAASPLSSDLISPTAFVYDMVYTPTVTPLMREAETAGARTMGGLAMLVYQGAASFELWTSREAPVEVMFEAARRALEG